MARRIYIEEPPNRSYQEDPNATYRVEVRRVGPDDGYAAGGWGHAPPQPRLRTFAGMRFSETELRHLAISVLVLTGAFSLALMGGIYGTISLGGFMVAMLISFVAVAPAFVVHEMAHKYLAQSYGCWSEFRYWGFGLMLAAISGFMGFMFAAPGAVYISGRITTEENGKISAAGPATNMGLSLMFIGIGIVSAWRGFEIGVILGAFASYLNLFLAGFNLIPISPFDGSKIWDWDKTVYIGMWVALFVIVAVQYFTIGI